MSGLLQQSLLAEDVGSETMDAVKTLDSTVDPRRTMDPILLEVLRNALVEVAEEMSVSIQRTAFSTNVKTRMDYSCAFVDAKGRMVAQAFCQPAHLVTIGRIVPRAVAEYGIENFEPGDGLVVNDPHRQASHLNDIFLISPFFHNGKLLGFASNVCHHVDVGGGAPASIGAFQEVYQEGIILPVVKLVSRGKVDEDLWKMIIANVRAKKEVAGDLRAQIAANEMGIRRLAVLAEKYGVDTLGFYIDRLLEYTEQRVRTELRKLPRGSFEAEGCLDDDGITPEPILLKARITIDAERIVFDFAGTDEQRSGPMNCNLTQTFTACVYVFKCLIDPDIPVNEGFYQPIEVIAPTGSAVNVSHPGAVVGGWEVCMRLVEILFKALSVPLPEQVPAGTKGMVCHVGFGGKDTKHGEYYTFLETLGGGYGGRFNSDGPDAVQTHAQNTQNAPIEEIELNYPVRITRYSLIPDSEGPGKFRGGLGLAREYAFLDHEPTLTTLADRVKFPPWGLFGGGSGRPARYLLIQDGIEKSVPSKGTVRIKKGNLFRVETCGGGGFGLAAERNPESVLRDVQEGKITAERATREYKVVFDKKTKFIDATKTQQLRQKSVRGAQK
jgi:N-methylhydantoinase B